MLILEKQLQPGSTVSLRVDENGVQTLRVHSPRPEPEWLKGVYKGGSQKKPEPDRQQDSATVLDYIKQRFGQENPPSIREIRDNVRVIEELKGISRDRFEYALRSLEQQGKITIIPSRGGRGSKTQIIPVL